VCNAGAVRRWDSDERGHGVAGAAAAVPALDRLRDAMLEPDWLTEKPEVHLLPHSERLVDGCASRCAGSEPAASYGIER